MFLAELETLTLNSLRISGEFDTDLEGRQICRDFQTDIGRVR